MIGLKELIGEDLHTQVTAKLGKYTLEIVEEGMKAFIHKSSDEVVITNNGDWIPKDKFKQKLDLIKLKEDEVADYKAKVDNLTKSKGNVDELQTEIGTLKTTITDNESKYKDSELKIRKTHALTSHLSHAGAKHPELLTGNFKLEDFELDDKDQIKDFDNHMKPIKEKYPDQFGQVILKNLKNPERIDHTEIAGFVTKEAFDNMSDKERVANIDKVNESSPFWQKQ